MTKRFCDRCGVDEVQPNHKPAVERLAFVLLRFNDEQVKTWDLCPSCRKSLDKALTEWMRVK